MIKQSLLLTFRPEDEGSDVHIDVDMSVEVGDRKGSMFYHSLKHIVIDHEVTCR